METKKNIAVVLSGCGVYDGAEIHESVFTMLAISRNGANYQLFAPNIEQYHVINHLTGQPVNEKRNVLVESARIARGDIKPLSEYNPTDFDALMFPGGFGVAKNFSSFAFDGSACTVNNEVEAVIKETNKAGKPIGALCISPVVIAKVLEGAEVTIGNDAGTVQALEEMGAKHRFTTHGEVVVDNKYKVVTTPCYMLDATIDQIATGAGNVVKVVLEMAN
jgi:enhancing lycopene biosynthesis protein 2